MIEQNAEIPENRRIELRIGINVGDIIIEGEDIYGDGVNIAARLEGIAEAGGICISRQAFDQIEGKLQPAYRQMGPQNLKNITKPIEVFSVEVDETEGNSWPIKTQPGDQILPDTGRRASGLRNFRQWAAAGEVGELDEPPRIRLGKPGVATRPSWAI